MGKRRPPYASGLPFSLQHFSLFGDRQTADQFSAQFSTLYNSFILSLSFSVSLTLSLGLCPPLVLLPVSLSPLNTSNHVGDVQ